MIKLLQSAVEDLKQTHKEFSSDQEVRWCPGCGDYAILSALQKALPELNVPRENHVFISGIGCSSRFPYYMNTFGFHTIHGRAPAIATGVKLANPDLVVWIISGDGDSMAIGGNHLIHLLRRNMDVNLIMFNNKIYGLTKGQLSPTSELGKVTKSTPFGSVDTPFQPASLAMGAEASFIARALDRDLKHLGQMILRAAQHHGASLLEVYQNCNIFNDGAFETLTDKKLRADNVLYLEHGKPMIFGANREKGIRLDGWTPIVVNLNTDDVSVDDLWFHDEQTTNPVPAFILSRMGLGYADQLPTPVGVFRAVDRPTYNDLLFDQIEQATQHKGPGTLGDLIYTRDVWEVKS